MRPLSLCFLLTGLLFMLLPGCASKQWQRGWELPATAIAPAAGPETPPSLEELQNALHHTRGEVDVLRLMQACRQRLDHGGLSPDEAAETYAMLGMLQTLMGAAYAEKRADKARWYVAALQSCERGMALRPVFRQAIDAGEPFDQAVHTLGRKDMELLFFWSVAMQYYFKECLTPLEYPFNFNWIKRSQAVLEHMRSLDPDWGRGALHFSRAILLLGLPEALGGDMQEAHAVLDRAIERWPKAIIFRWGRAKYWCTKARDRQCFEQDLRWVLRQDPGQTEQPPYPWNAYFIRDARTMLREADALF